MNLQDAIGAPLGVTAVIGSGGKTTLLRELARELSAEGATVALAASTRILPFDGIPTVGGTDEAAIVRALSTNGVACVAEAAEKGKLSAPAIGFERLATLADYVLVEADGSKRLPLKAHAPWEPVIPECAGKTILLVGANGFGHRISDAVHRPEIFCDIAGCSLEDAATPENVGQVLEAESLADAVIANQAESPEELGDARRLANAISAPLFAGSVQAHSFIAL